MAERKPQLQSRQKQPEHSLRYAGICGIVDDLGMGRVKSACRVNEIAAFGDGQRHDGIAGSASRLINVLLSTSRKSIIAPVTRAE